MSRLPTRARLAVAGWLLAAALAAAAPAAEVSRGLARALQAPDARVDLLVVLADRADLAPAATVADRTARARQVRELLTATARASQAGLRAELGHAGFAHRPFWVVNAIAVRGADRALVERLARRPDVLRLDRDPAVAALAALPPGAAEPAGEAPTAVGGNIAWVGAPAAWARNVRGQGVVIGLHDSGVDWDHPALRPHYRGWSGSSAAHDHHWHDAVHEAPGNPCGADLPAPCDDHGHGTHVAGTAVGADPNLVNQIGMAPGAKWIGCRSMDVGVGTPSAYLECFEWFLAPTNLAGGDPDPALAPDIVNNSWACPPDEGCDAGNVALLGQAIESLRAAGVLVVASAGNEGWFCASLNHAGAIFDAATTTTATTWLSGNDVVADYASRGPVVADGSGRRKPDLAAPGSCIRSSLNGGGYGGESPCSWLGTSMAAPHVAGLAALVVAADPAHLRGNVEGIEELLREGAQRVVYNTFGAPDVCPDPGGIPVEAVPNNHFGFGRIDAAATLALLLDQGLVFRDGFETGDRSDWSRRVP